jgi:hypothetical protein
VGKGGTSTVHHIGVSAAFAHLTNILHAAAFGADRYQLAAGTRNLSFLSNVQSQDSRADGPLRRMLVKPQWRSNVYGYGHDP